MASLTTATTSTPFWWAFCWLPDLQQPCCQAASQRSLPWNPCPWLWIALKASFCHCPWAGELICACSVSSSEHFWSSAGRHKIAKETRHFFIFNVAFLAHLTYNETTLQEGIYSVNYCCQSKANHAVNSTVTQMTNNFKGKENQDFVCLLSTFPGDRQRTSYSCAVSLAPFISSDFAKKF